MFGAISASGLRRARVPCSRLEIHDLLVAALMVGASPVRVSGSYLRRSIIEAIRS
jgi:hypothetical protein